MKRLNWSLGPQATANFGLVLIVLVFNSVVVHRNTVALHTAQKAINHTHQILNQSQTLVSALRDAESVVRGYVITGDESSLPDFDTQAAFIIEQVRRLRDSVTNLGQMTRIDQLDHSLTARLNHLRNTIAVRKHDGFDAARKQIELAGGIENRTRTRELIQELQAAESDLMRERTRDQDNRRFIILGANIAAVIVGVTITIVAWYLVERELGKRRAAEANAHLERQNLWVTLTSIADGVIVCDDKGWVKLVNPVAQLLLGNPKDAIGRPLSEICSIVDEQTREPVENPVNQALSRAGSLAAVEQTVLIRVDGTEIPIEQSAAAIRNKSGKMTGVVFVFRDCSARRHVERELIERERRFRRVFESPLMGIAILSAEGFLVEANEFYLDLIGYRRSELNVAALSWDGRPNGQSPLDDSAQFELRENAVCRPFERTYTRSDGTRVPVLISAAQLLDDQHRIVIFVTDLSQSKRAEAALRESEARFRVLSECMPQKVWTAGPDGRFDYLNNMLLEYAGVPADQLTGWGWTNLIHPDDLQFQVNAWKHSLAHGEMFEIEHRLRKRTGEYRWHLARALPVYRPDGQIAMWVGTNTDIHDQKQAEESLREEHHRKDQFLALLAHELRNPLSPLSNAIQVFPAVQHDPANSAALLGIMQRQVRQMTRLIDDLLDLARITTGRMRLRRERIVAESVVSAAVEAVQPLITERNHQLKVSVPSEQLWLDADSARLSQILTNLLHNAAKYTDPNGRLSLTVERDGSDVLFRIRDNGPGISKEMLTKIFELFTQVELTLDRAHGGLGIGLTLVRTLVELHQGQVTATSEGLGQGSEFVVRLPLLEPDKISVAAPAATGSAEPQKELPLLRVLVVDDVQASAKTLALMLKTLGQKVDVAFDGPTALEKIASTMYELVFLDIAMPGMDGLEVARRIRELPDRRSVTLVALTGFGQDEDRANSLQAGFNDHLTKPTSMDILKETLRNAATRAVGRDSI